MGKIILHCDCNCFFASVEETLKPELKDVPMAVAGDPHNRHGIILAKNQKAKKYDITTAETVWQAKRKCPDLVLVSPHYDLYHDFYKKINKIYLDYTDLVEPFSIDESYLDVTGTLHLFNKTPLELADEIRERVKRELGITISIGVSYCKVFAKLGSDYKKPDATTVIMKENLSEIAFPLPVSDMLFVGKKSSELLRSYGINTIGDLYLQELDFLKRILGKQGEQFYNYFHGDIDDPVHSFYDIYEFKSISNGMTFRRDLVGEEEVRCGVSALSDSVAARLRGEHKKAFVVQVTIKDPQLSSIQRQRKLETPTHLQKEITGVAMQLISENWSFNNPIRLITISCSDLVPEDESYEQLNLFSGNKPVSEKQEKIENAMAGIREKYGNKSIKFGYHEDEELGIKIFGKGE